MQRTSAVADTINGLVLIEGEEFGVHPPIVVLDGFVLTIVNFGPTNIVAALPATVAANPGSYHLLVSHRRGRRRPGDR